jgi:putative Mg2+ transporter-C (MgtC) family protein
VIQGIATGVGFLGAGAIMKEKDAHVIRGLTTAAGIWMTAAIGVAIGLGRLGSAALGTVFAWFVLAIVIKAEARIHGGGAAQ